MTVFTSVIFLCLVLIDDDLISLALLEDLSFYGISFYERCACNELVSAYCYDLIKYDLIAYFSIELFNFELIALLYSVLLATCLDDSILN